MVSCRDQKTGVALTSQLKPPQTKTTDQIVNSFVLQVSGTNTRIQQIEQLEVKN
jgi:hypothetical protein